MVEPGEVNIDCCGAGSYRAGAAIIEPIVEREGPLRLEHLSSLLNGEFFKPAIHFYCESSACPSICKCQQHHFMSTKMEQFVEEREYKIEIIHCRLINSDIAKMCGWSDRDLQQNKDKKPVVWIDEIRIESEGYKEKVKKDDGKWRVAEDPAQETELFKALKAGKWCVVTDDAYPSTPPERSDVVSAGIRRIKETTDHPANNYCATFVKEVLTKKTRFPEPPNDKKSSLSCGCGY